MPTDCYLLPADEACQLIATYCQKGWPRSTNAPALVKPYLPMAAGFTVEHDLLMRGSQIVIPPPLRQEILKRIHNGAGRGLDSLFGGQRCQRI